jgi:hypothetical protein
MLAEMMPFPNEETTPPVTKIYFVSINNIFMGCKGTDFWRKSPYARMNFDC